MKHTVRTQVKHKLSSKLGESLAESLVALLIAALSITILLTLIRVSVRVVDRGTSLAAEYYEEVNALEERETGVTVETVGSGSKMRLDIDTTSAYRSVTLYRKKTSESKEGTMIVYE